MTKKSFAIIITAIILAMLFSTAGMADHACEVGNFGGSCTELEVITEESTRRVTGYNAHVNYYEEEWGWEQSIMAEGYWAPREGERGVTYRYYSGSLPSPGSDGVLRVKKSTLTGGALGPYWANSCNWLGFAQGYEVVYHNGHWELVTEIERIPVRDLGTCEGRGGFLNPEGLCENSISGEAITYTVEWVKLLTLSSAACEYHKADGARWFDSRDEYQLIPFEDIIVENWQSITVVSHFYGMSLTMPFPCPKVTRTPYPRAIVGEEAFFTLEPEVITASSETIDTCTPDIMNYQIHAMLEPANDFVPVWFWDERPWTTGDTVTQGWTAAHIWNTASYSLDGRCENLYCDKPSWGPSLIGEWLPSYKVTVTSAYRLYARRTWTDFYGQAHDTGWEIVDMRQYGYNTDLLIVTGARDATIAQPGAMAPRDISECIVPVPVIEAQSILTGP